MIIHSYKEIEILQCKISRFIYFFGIYSVSWWNLCSIGTIRCDLLGTNKNPLGIRKVRFSWDKKKCCRLGTKEWVHFGQEQIVSSCDQRVMLSWDEKTSPLGTNGRVPFLGQEKMLYSWNQRVPFGTRKNYVLLGPKSVSYSNKYSIKDNK